MRLRSDTGVEHGLLTILLTAGKYRSKVGAGSASKFLQTVGAANKLYGSAALV
jgi:hypothetical protein